MKLARYPLRHPAIWSYPTDASRVLRLTRAAHHRQCLGSELVVPDGIEPPTICL